MTKVKIDKGVPYKAPKVGRHPKYPWAEMEIGDSFVFDKIAYNSALKTAHNNSQNLGRKFRVGWVKEGIRCWRLS